MELQQAIPRIYRLARQQAKLWSIDEARRRRDVGGPLQLKLFGLPATAAFWKWAHEHLLASSFWQCRAPGLKRVGTDESLASPTANKKNVAGPGAREAVAWLANRATTRAGRCLLRHQSYRWGVHQRS